MKDRADLIIENIAINRIMMKYKKGLHLAMKANNERTHNGSYLCSKADKELTKYLEDNGLLEI